MVLTYFASSERLRLDLNYKILKTTCYSCGFAQSDQPNPNTNLSAWRIEVYFKVIKSGFKAEDCRLESADRLIRFLAVVSIVAWRVYWLTLVSRTTPDISSLLFLNDFDWKILFVKFNPDKNIPKRSPSMKQITLWIAQLAGFLNRKSDGDQGVTHVWRGLKKFANLIEGAHILKNIYG